MNLQQVLGFEKEDGGMVKELIEFRQKGRRQGERVVEPAEDFWEEY